MYLQKSKSLVRLLLLMTLIWVLMACGGQKGSETPSAQKTGSEESAQPPAKAENTANLNPTEVPESKVELPAVETRQAATVHQAAQLLDLRTLAFPAEVQPMSQAEVGYLSYQAPLAVAEVVDFYRPLLTGQGWQENSEQGYVDDTTATLYFTKEAFAVSLSASKMSEASAMITLMNHGNIDPRALPQMADAEGTLPAPNTLIYFSATPVAEVAKFTRQALAGQGWQEFTRPGTDSTDEADTQIMAFKQNGLELTAYIATAPAQNGKTSVQYNLALLPLDLPTYNQVSQLEFDKAQPYLSYQTAADVPELVEFYRQQMSDLGWVELADAAAISPEQAALFFANDPEQVALMLDLSRSGNQTVATLRSFDAAELTTLADELPTDEPVEAGAVPAGEVPNLPTPEDAQDNAYDPDAAQITYTSPSDVATLAEFYRQALPDQGWQEAGDFATVDDAFGFLEFSQGDDSLSITMFRIDSSTEVMVDVSGIASLVEGVESTTPAEAPPAADAPAYTINDWPVPAEAENVNVSGETLSYVVAWNLPTTAEFYRATFELMELDTDCLDDAAEYTSMSCGLSTGDFLLNFFAFESGDNQTEVEISFTNYALEATGTAETPGQDAEVLTAEDKDGLPVPSNYTSYSSEGTQFSRQINLTSPADPQTLLEFFQKELAASGWQPVGEAKTAEDVTTLVFEGPEGKLTLKIEPAGSETEINLVSKNPTAAAQAGILPPAGKARIYMVSFSLKELTVTINDQVLKVPAEAGLVSPDDAPKLDLPPATYQFTTEIGGSTYTGEITVGEDEVWSLLFDQTEALPSQIY